MKKIVNTANKTYKNSNTSNSTNNTKSKNDFLPSENDLNSYYNQLELINLKLEKSFYNQKETAEKNLLEKINECTKLREYYFNHATKLKNMNNISRIEDFFSMNYSRILSIQSKLNSVIEFIDDLKCNINYGMDRLYLEDNIVCDETALRINLNTVNTSLENLNIETSEKFKNIEDIKRNLNSFLNLIEEERLESERLKVKMEEHKTKVIDKNIKSMYTDLVKENAQLELELYK